MPETIYDLGLHKGEDSEFYLRKGFRVVGVEADPELCVEAGTRLAQYIASGQMLIVNAAIAPVSGPVCFYRNVRSEWGTIMPAWSRQNAGQGCASVPIEVEGLTLVELLQEHGPAFFLKVDIEGMDRLALESLNTVPDRPKYLSMESAFPRNPWMSGIHSEVRTLTQLGYDRFKIVSQGEVSQQVPPSLALAGRHVPHRFPPGSSGLFAEEVPGAWLDAQAALGVLGQIVWHSRPQSLLYRNMRLYTCYGKMVQQMTGTFPHLGWYDIHAKHSTVP